MKKVSIFLFFSIIIACNQKTKVKSQNEDFFPVLSFIRSQVAHVDTSFYSIYKVTWRDSVHTDTDYYKREEFGSLAKDFLQMPDISVPQYKSQYTEEKFYDEGMNKVIITYLPKDSLNRIIERQEVLIDIRNGDNKVNSFIIKLTINNKDSTEEKNLLWKVDKSFQVSSKIQKPDEKEIIKRFKVIWNENDDE